MKKLFTEPDVEILSFLCDEPTGVDSVTVGGGSGGIGGGEGDGEMPLS